MGAINYTSTSELASYVADYASDPSTSLSTLMGLLIPRVSRQIDTYTGRQFYTSTADETRTFDGTGSYRFIPDSLGIISITTLKLATDTHAASSSTYTTIDARDYFLMPRQPRTGWSYQWIELSNDPVGSYSTSYSFTLFPLGYGTVQAIGRFGDWNTTAVGGQPDDIRHVAAELVIREWRARNMSYNDAIGVDGLQVAPFSRGIPYDLRLILDAYRRKNVG